MKLDEAIAIFIKTLEEKDKRLKLRKDIIYDSHFNVRQIVTMMRELDSEGIKRFSHDLEYYTTEYNGIEIDHRQVMSVEALRHTEMRLHSAGLSIEWE